MLSFNRL